MCKPLSFCIHQTVIDSGLLDSDQPFSRNEIGSPPLTLWLDSPTLGPEKVKQACFSAAQGQPGTREQGSLSLPKAIERARKFTFTFRFYELILLGLRMA
jgi:hypothetical protein